MNKWVKRYLILTICLVLVFLPLLSILKEFNVFETPTSRMIFWIVFGVVVIAYYLTMTILMIKGDKKYNNDRK